MTGQSDEEYRESEVEESSAASTSSNFISTLLDKSDGIILLNENNVDNNNDNGGNNSSSEEEDQGNLRPTENNHSNKNESITKQIFSLALPAFLALSIDPVMALVDTAFIGKTSINADALAGVGTSSALLTFTFYLFNFLTTVTTPMVSQKRASGNLNDAITIGGQALTLAFILGPILTILLVIFSNPLLDIMGVNNLSNDATRIATSFLQLRAFAATAIFLSSASTGILRGFLDTQTALIIVIGSNIINLSLDFLLISYAQMGPTGAAIATTTAEYCAAFAFLGVLGGILPSAAEGKLIGSNQQRCTVPSDNQDNIEQQNMLEEPLLLSTQSFETNDNLLTIRPTLQLPSWNRIKPMIVASSSSFLRSFTLQLVLAGATAMVTRSGYNNTESAAANIAAHQISLRLWILGSFLCDALAAASQALISDSIARNDDDGTRKICKSIFMYSLVQGSLLSLLLFILNLYNVLFPMFTNDISTQESLKSIFLILTLSQPLNAYVFAADGIIQGASEFVYEAKCMLLSALVAVVCFFILESSSNINELESVWYSLVILMVMRGLAATYKIMEFFR